MKNEDELKVKKLKLKKITVRDLGNKGAGPTAGTASVSRQALVTASSCDGTCS